MNETIINQAIKGINGMKIIRMDRKVYRTLNYFQTNSHSRLLAHLFSSSSVLSSRREMLFITLREIYLRSQQLLTVLQWMQPPIQSNSELKKDRPYLKVIANAQQQGTLGIVTELIYIIEIERFLKVIQFDNKEITLKILYELGLNIGCLIQGKQEYILYDKFFAYLYHQFNTDSNFIEMSYQQREFLKKLKQQKSQIIINEKGLRKLGQISNNYIEGGLSDDYYDSIENLLLSKGVTQSLDYKFIGFRFNLKEDLSINAIYIDQLQQYKLYLRNFQLFASDPIFQPKQTTISKYMTLKTLVSQSNNIPESDQMNPLSLDQEHEIFSNHQQTSCAEEVSYRVEYEASDQNEFDYSGGLELNFANFDPDTTVMYQVFSVNSECVAGIKISFPEEHSSFPLIEFPCIQNYEQGFDCHTFQFKPLSSLRGIQIEKVKVPPNLKLIKNFVFLVQDSEQQQLKEYKFDFQKNQEMGDIENLHDKIMPYFTDEWRKAKFSLYFSYSYAYLDEESQKKIENKLKMISLVINSMFPNIQYLENKKKLINPYIFEIFAQSLGRYQVRDQYQRYIFLQLDHWAKLFEANVIETILDNLLIFIWSSGGTEGISKMQRHQKP